jgi:hypothetical protein
LSRHLPHLVRNRGSALAALAGVVLALACIPSNPDADDDYVANPLEPAPHVAHLRGRVRDFNTGAPITGARVEAEGVSVVTSSDGAYAIGGLRVLITTLVTTKEGYDTSRVQIALPRGDSQFDPRLRVSATLSQVR